MLSKKTRYSLNASLRNIKYWEAKLDAHITDENEDMGREKWEAHYYFLFRTIDREIDELRSELTSIESRNRCESVNNSVRYYRNKLKNR